jgi:hypothetical protein
MPSQKLSKAEQILDLLLDALLERQAARRTGQPPSVAEDRLEAASVPAPQPAAPPPPAREPTIKPLPSQPAAEQPSAQRAQPSAPSPQPRPLPPALASVHLGRTLGRLLVVLVVLVVLVNVPITRYGTSLARMMPDTAALVIRDGLVLKGSGPDIYVMQDNRLRWISSLEAFEYYGYHWDQVHEVDDEFLADFERGKPLHVLLKCQRSPHIYALENGAKRWIKDIPTFEAEGYVWQDVKMVDCPYLRRLPDGPPIPEDAGPPPEP